MCTMHKTKVAMHIVVQGIVYTLYHEVNHYMMVIVSQCILLFVGIVCIRTERISLSQCILLFVGVVYINIESASERERRRERMHTYM